ncbi:hypothetical protein CP354_02265 [Lactobacillus sp. UMNPBX3]|nr:hypothetical protein CP354_02265 [Lactobacillus sp. UMNPBX3]
MRVTIDLMKKSTQIIDLSNVINPRVGDDDLLLPLHIVYGDNQTDMRGKDVEFLSNDTNGNRIYVAGTCNTNTPGDNLYMGNLTFRFPAGTFKADGTYDPDKTMFRIVDKATHKVISSVNVKITVMKNAIEFDFDPDKTSYDSRLENMLHDFHDKGQAMLDEIKDLNNQAKSNVSGDTATTANEAKKQADQNAGDISDLKDEVAGARGRFANMAGREDAQDISINQKESIANANDNYALLQQKDEQQDTIIANKAGKFELEAKLAQMDIHPEVFENLAALQAKYPNGAPGMMITADTEHKYVYLNNQWEDKGQFVFNDLNPKDKELLYKRSSNNILINPDLINDAECWTITSGWVEDPTHSIGKSMAYGCLLTEDPKEEISIYQKGIPVKGKQKLSMGVQVISDNSGTAKMQVIFRDESDSIIENTSAGIIFSTIEKRGLQKKLENIKIPDNAVTAAFTISTSSKGLVIICRPQMNFGEKLIPYSILEINNERIDVDNVLANPDLINDAEGWAITSGWVEDPTHSIGKSMAYGCTRDENSTEETSIYQRDISVINRTVLSAAVEVITTSNDCHAGLQILFRNSQGEILADDIHSLEFPHTLNGFEKFKLENIKIPDNAVTAAFTVTFTGTGVVIICRPQIVFNEKIIPYSLSEITIEQQNKANSVLPQFNIGISGSGIGDKWVKSSFSFQRNGQEIKGFVQIAIQGDSSRNHDKKNYKIKVFSDENCKQKLKLRLMPSWPKTNKFNLKANFIDATQSRNLASAKLVAAATAVTPIADPTVESNLAKTSNFGQMEGFPIEVWLNGVYNGLYTCNTKKDDVVLGLNANEEGNAAISVLDNVAAPSSQLLKDPTAKLDNVAYADELHDTPDPELVANWSKWLDFLNNSSDEDFKNKLPSYIDVKSAINVYLFGIMSREYDYNTKSVLYLTWNNGKYFYLVPYDLDSNWGQSATGVIEGNPADENWGFSTETTTKQDGKYISNANWNKLFERMYKLFMPEIKEQYTYLRSNVWRTDQLLDAYRDFMNGIPQEAYQKDQKLWPQIPSVETNTYEQLHQVIVQRSNQMDKWIKTK